MGARPLPPHDADAGRSLGASPEPMAKDSRSPPRLRSGALLDYEGLRLATAEAIEKDGRTQTEIGAGLSPPRKPSAISNAVKMAGANVASLQLEIIEHVGGYTSTGPYYRLAKA